MKLVLPLFLLLFGVSALATEFRVDGDRLVVSGFLDYSERKLFEKYLVDGPQINQIVFTKCNGGHLGAAYYYAEVIKKRALSTSVVGQAQSACAIAFLAGFPRFPANGQRNTLLSLHVGRSQDENIINNIEVEKNNRNLIEFINNLTEGKIPPRIMGLIKTSNLENSGVYFVSSTKGFFNIYDTYYCDGSQGVDTSKCVKLTDANPVEMAIFKK